MPTLMYKGYNEEGNLVTGCKSINHKELKEYLNKNNIRSHEIYESKTKYSKTMTAFL